MRGVFVNFVALLTRNAVATRCVFADLYTWFIYDTLYIRLKLAGSSHVLTKFMDAQRRTAQMFVPQGMDGLCIYDWGITIFCHMLNPSLDSAKLAILVGIAKKIPFFKGM